MIDVTLKIDIARPRETVAAYAMEAENDPAWIGGISSAQRLTPPPTGVGTRVERVASFRGKRIEYVMDVIDHVPGRKIVLKTVKGPFPMEVTYAFEDRDRGTRAFIRVAGDTKGFYRLAAPLLVRGVKRNVGRDLKRLKKALESGIQGPRTAG
ncbi:MAG: SRPBCC family protein [Actinomycetota bacterium]